MRAFQWHKIFPCIVLFILSFPIPSRATPYDAIYVLGDSLSDQGNFLAVTTVANAANPAVPVLPDPLHYFDGRFSNGLVYTDYLSQMLGVPLAPSFGGGTNFAFGGARTAYNVGDSMLPGNTIAWSLNGEIAAFNNRNIHDPNGLYILFSGSNDLADILTHTGTANIPDLLAGVQAGIDAFKAAGAQTILVPNIPNLGLTPAAAALDAAHPGAAAAATAFTQQYNALLHALLAGITGVNVVEFDTFDWLTNIVNNPAAFELSNVTNACYSGFVTPPSSFSVCADPNDYLFWDIEHPTTVGHELLAEAMFSEVARVPEGATLPLVLGGLLFLAAGMRLRPAVRRRETHSPSMKAQSLG